MTKRFVVFLIVPLTAMLDYQPARTFRVSLGLKF